jgi:hypothetical protein
MSVSAISLVLEASSVIAFIILLFLTFFDQQQLGLNANFLFDQKKKVVLIKKWHQKNCTKNIEQMEPKNGTN